MATARINGVELHYNTVGSGARLVLTHGSWTDGSGWDPAIAQLATEHEVVTWDRRGHSRSRSGDGPGSRAEDAADLAALIEHLGGGPVHLAGNSYGAIVTLTVAAARPDLVLSAAAHEPPALALLHGTRDIDGAGSVAEVVAAIAHVAELIESGDHVGAARYFIDHVALGPGSWEQLPSPVRAIFATNAPTYLDETLDPTSATVDVAALATTAVPLLFSGGTESPPFFAAILRELARLLPAARFESIAGAGHIPHATHPETWASMLLTFQHAVAGASLGVSR